MTQTDRQVVVLTGASTGLGLAIAKELLARGDYHLVLTARQASLSRFEQSGISASETVWLRPLDVTDHRQRCQLIKEVNSKLGGVDILINNAGISYRSTFEHVTERERHHQMDVNFVAPMELTRLVLPTMRRQRFGRVINISSAGGFMAMPTMGIYAASKFALEAATESLYYEVKPFGIKVSLVLPGFINSEGFERVLLSGKSRDAATHPKNAYYPHYHHMSGFVGRVMKSTPSKPKHVARKVARLVRARWPRLRVPATPDTHLLWWFRRFVPHRVYTFVLYRLLPGVKSWGRSQKLR